MDGVVAGAAVEPPVDLSLEAWKAAFAAEVSRTSETVAAPATRRTSG
jgi:hypothetical protein